jgi:hypothetical protein
MHTPGTRRIWVAIAVGLLAGPRAHPDEVCTDAVDVADPIYLLRYIFQGGPEPPPPFLECDKDPTQGRLSCGFRFSCG